MRHVTRKWDGARLVYSWNRNTAHATQQQLEESLRSIPRNTYAPLGVQNDLKAIRTLLNMPRFS